MALDSALLEQITRELRADEGTRTRLYDDATSKTPILAQWRDGHLVPSTRKDGGPAKLTGGVGRNFSDRPLSDAAIQFLLDEDIAEAERVARKFFLAFDTWTQNRKAAVINLIFAMGETTFSGFHETIPLLQTGRWGEAADHLAASAWAREVQPSRIGRVVAQIRNG
jgi:hypothetical protein